MPRRPARRHVLTALAIAGLVVVSGLATVSLTRTTPDPDASPDATPAATQDATPGSQPEAPSNVPTATATEYGPIAGAGHLLVEGSPEAVKSWVAECRSTSSNGRLDDCLQVSLSDLQQNHGTTAMVGVFARAMDADPEIAQACHPVSHVLGQEGYELAGDIATALRAGSEVCELGYIHGAFEAWGLDSNPAELKATVIGLCDQVAEGHPERVRQDCGHGVGHAAWTAADGDIATALSVCETLTDSARSQCGGGATMSMIGGIGGTPGVSLATADEVVEFCREFPEEFRFSCIGETGYLMFVAGGGDILKAQDNCKLLVDDEFDAEACIGALGRIVPGSASLDPDVMVEMCVAAGPDALVDACLFQVVQELLAKKLLADQDLHGQVCDRAPASFAARCDDITLDS